MKALRMIGGTEQDLVHRTVMELRQSCLGVYVFALALTAPFADFSVTFSVALGGALAMVNMNWLGKSLRKILDPSDLSAAAQMAVTMSFHIRMILIAAITLAFVWAGWIHFPALILGLSVTVIAILFHFLLRAPLTGAAGLPDR